MEQITQRDYDAMPSDYEDIWHSYFGNHREWMGKRTAFLPGHGTTLFIEGISFEIVEG